MLKRLVETRRHKWHQNHHTDIMHKNHLTPLCKTIFPSPGRVLGNSGRVCKKSPVYTCIDFYRIYHKTPKSSDSRIFTVITLKVTGRGSSIGSEFAWHASGPEFHPHVRHILSWRLGHENISTAILPLPLIQEEQLSVTGERMCTKYW